MAKFTPPLVKNIERIMLYAGFITLVLGTVKYFHDEGVKDAREEYRLHNDSLYDAEINIWRNEVNTHIYNLDLDAGYDPIGAPTRISKNALNRK